MILKRCLLPQDSPKRLKEMIPSWITIHEVSLGLGKTPSNYNFAHYYNLLTNDTSIGYHFLVESNIGAETTIYQFLETTIATHHAGDGDDGIGNTQSIGIERMVNVDTDFESAINAQAMLAATLMQMYSIPLEHVVPHKHWSGKECPSRLLAGLYGGFDGFLEKVQYYFDKKCLITGICK